MDHERSDGFAMDTFSPDYLAVETKDCVRQQRSLDARSAHKRWLYCY